MAAEELPGFALDAPGASLQGMGVLELSWDVFGELCRALAVNVARSYEPELVVGIAKAGVIPGAVIASILRLDFFSMKISRRSGFEEVRDRPQLLTSAPREARGKRVLIVDEICTTGETLRMALAAVRAESPADIRTATSFVKSGQYKPDFFAVETDATVIFPWDRQVLGEEGALVENPRYEHLL
ncbi:MAG: phosphoribosyltransferase family protein [Longimicrobiales bacterium]|nr:phosphoribosyltransferase family protein [Longimicrobiales bacterium]